MPSKSTKFCNCRALIVNNDVSERIRCQRLTNDDEYCSVIYGVWGIKSFVSGIYMGLCSLKNADISFIKSYLKGFLEKKGI